jgi:tetratricopeptide (TPR) repeat protein
LYKLEDFEGALEALDRAGKILLKTKGPMHSSTGANLQHRARVFVAIGNVAEAKELYEQSVRSYEGSLGPEHPEIIGVYAELAEVLAKLGEIEDAKQFYERAITVSELTLPATHPYAISLSEDYGEFLQRVATN